MSRIDASGTRQARESKSSQAPENRWRQEPGERDLLVLTTVIFILFIGVILLFRNYSATVDDFGDSSAYMNVARAIRLWDFRGIVIKQFWGLPYLMALLSFTTHLSDRSALLLVSAGSSMVSVVLASRLWGGWVAGFFAILNFDWMQRSLLGGSEPLSVALLFGSFLAVRRERWPLAALLAALSTITRPLGVFALLGIGIVLLWKKEFRTFIVAFTIGISVGIAYSIPVTQHFGSPVATVSSYYSPGWQGGRLFGVPFYAIVKGTLAEHAPWTNLVLSFGWISFVLLAVFAMFSSESFRAHAREHPVEILFAAPYLWFLFSYNYPHWARGNFARFAIPIIPFTLLALYRWLPKDRRIIWSIGILSTLLAASSALGIRNVASALHKLLG